MKNISFAIFSFVLIATISLTGCKKPLSFSKGNLDFSRDTLVFDTVFTTVGSVTKQLKIYNPDNKSLKIEQIELVGGSNSPFRINVDGTPGVFLSDIEMEAKDSLYIFVEVTLDPNNQTNPMVIEDKIRFRTNGVDQYVVLAAWGQDAYFHYSYISQGQLNFNSGTWPNDKPHVIYGGAFVDSAQSLTIQAGTDIYLHKGAYLYIYKGSLHINGTLGNEVTLQGDRLEAFYDDVPGQYYGIYFHEAQPSTIQHTTIRNATSGIHLFSESASNPGYTLEISNSKILNSASYGVFVYSGAKVKAENCVIAKNGIHSLLVLEGGDFNFNNCTLAGYGQGDESAVVGISNYYTRPDANGIPTTFIGNINEGTISNSIIFGNGTQEIAIDTLNPGGVTLNFDFNYNHIRSEVIPTDPFFTNNTYNTDPYFVNIENDDFSVWWTATSPILHTANPATATSVDIDGISRFSNNGPDKGAYEYH